jgi:uncharacterized protein DUF3455
MRRRLFTSLTAAAAVAASLLISIAGPAGAQTATADLSTAAGSTAVTPNAKVPEAIRVDETKFKIVATLKGIGKQVYTCGTDGKYALREPVAVLVNLRSGDAGIHGKGPFWAGFDGSRVDGSAPVSVPSPAGPSNIAWLKVVGTPVANAPGMFGAVAFIQRIDTKGGAAPATCTTPTVSVDYSTNYVFWAPK